MKKIIFTALIILLTIANKGYAGESLEQIDDYTVKITIENVNEADGVKNTYEKNYTLDDLIKMKAQAEQSLQTWQDKKVEDEKNIAIQTEQILIWDKLFTEAKEKGIKEKPVIDISTEN